MLLLRPFAEVEVPRFQRSRVVVVGRENGLRKLRLVASCSYRKPLRAGSPKKFVEIIVMLFEQESIS